MKSPKSGFTFFNGSNRTYLESLYQEAGREKEWDTFFSTLLDTETVPLNESIQTSNTWLKSAIHKQAQVSKLIMAYRYFGHLSAKIDPIAVMTRGKAIEMELAQYELSEDDLDTEFDLGDMANGGCQSLRNIINYLKHIYCGSIGYEIQYLTDLNKRTWLLKHVENGLTKKKLSKQDRISCLEKLTAAEGLEKYLHTKYVGQKRFSLEGGDVLIPMISDLIEQLGNKGVSEIVIGMAHRGRLNMLVNILGKSPQELFSEFEGKYETADSDTKTGDVKYHQGASSNIKTRNGTVHVALSCNPSHLEIINPVVEGIVRARQQRREDKKRMTVVPILIHGDAAFSGQGVVMETLQMSTTRGYSTGGTIHIIINNQIGFTTNTLDARSTLYCTEAVKMVQAPIFHVNADDPDAVINATRLAIQYRMKFGGDVALDIVCYRRHGHNEADEPTMTQPIMYRRIKKHKTTREIYANHLILEGLITKNQSKKMIVSYKEKLDHGLIVAGQGQVMDLHKSFQVVDWLDYTGNQWDECVNTGVNNKHLTDLARQLSKSPTDFIVHDRVQKVLDDRVSMASGKKQIDWGCAELLAYATLIKEGYQVRLSGQDAGRGTFSHRHATLHDQLRPNTYIPLQYISNNSNDFLVINSLLSEEAVLGFEYGYSTTDPKTLVIWEGQFGDFVNGAQVVIDQFISSGQAKWSKICSLVMFLPHGMEGQGPEHSSARLERFLQLCAEHNMQVCIPTSPAQIFHMLRRQMLRSFRRPLIVMTPKSLLRHKLSVSNMEELSKGKFHPVIAEMDSIDILNTKRLVICCGKIYYDLLKERRHININNIAIIRIEQIHPFPTSMLKNEIKKYKYVEEVVWCQEEPKNQGCWYQISHYLRHIINDTQKLFYIGREGSPSPAVGYHRLHTKQQTKLIKQALMTVGIMDK